MSNNTSTTLYGGIEGGASHSTCVIINYKGDVLSRIVGKSTNPWLFNSDDEWAKVIKDLVDACKLKLKSLINNNNLLLETLCISMSGCEDDHASKLEKLLTLTYKPEELAKSIIINHDTDGAIFTASDNGGIVLISGTGSAAQLFYPLPILNEEQSPQINIPGEHEIDKFRIGGWGYALGDEGSAYWIARKAIKIVYDHNDRLVISHYPITYIEKCMKEYFKIQHPDDVLKYFYKSFDKSFIAKFCLKIAEGAKEFNDPMCLHLFYLAGKDLARHIVALLRKANMKKFMSQSEIRIICVGSMWKDWDLLKPGFMEIVDLFSQEIKFPRVDGENMFNGYMENSPGTFHNGKPEEKSIIITPGTTHDDHDYSNHTFVMYYLTETAALGAAFIGALVRKNVKIPLNYAETTQFLQQFTL